MTSLNKLKNPNILRIKPRARLITSRNGYTFWKVSGLDCNSYSHDLRRAYQGWLDELYRKINYGN